MSRKFMLSIGAVGVLVGSFFGTLFVGDRFTPEHILNQTRIANVTLIKDAIDRFHQDRHAYPALPLGPVETLHKDLVEGGYLKQIPPPTGGFQFVYLSDGLKMYGLLVHLKEEDFLLTKKPGGLCTVGVGIKGTGAWGDPPECKF